MTGPTRADKWLAAAAAGTPKTSQRHDAEGGNDGSVSAEIHRQVDMDVARTYAKMLIGYESSEEEVVRRRQKVTDLMIKWLRNEEKLTYMQGMNHLMATCCRELKDEDAALQVFDFVIRQADENLFHPDADKLFTANQGLAEKLREMVREQSPKVAQRLAEVDIDFLPMIVQNWLIDLFLHVLPTEAAARLWDHMLESQGVPLKFAAQLLLSGKEAILSCLEEDLQEVLSDLPSRIESPEDVDLLLYSDFADGIEIEQIVDHYVQEKQVQVQEEPMQVQANLLPDPLEGNVPLQVFELKPAVKMPRRWQPWKFITVAMVIPWLLMHATQLHEPSLSKRAAPPMLHKASLPVVLHFVPMHEANWPK